MASQRAGMVLSMIGMLVTVISFQVKSRKTLLIWQTIGTCFYLVSYIFSSGGIAVILNAIYIVRNFIYIKRGEEQNKKLYIIAMSLCALYIISYFVYIFVSVLSFEEKLWNSLPVIGAIFGTIAVVNTDVNKLRFWKFGDSVSWLTFNFYLGLGALGGIIGEILNVISLCVGIVRYRKKTADKSKGAL